MVVECWGFTFVVEKDDQDDDDDDDDDNKQELVRSSVGWTSQSRHLW